MGPSNLKPTECINNTANNKKATRLYSVAANIKTKENNNQKQSKYNSTKSVMDTTLNLILEKLNSLDRRIVNLEKREQGAISQGNGLKTKNIRC